MTGLSLKRYKSEVRRGQQTRSKGGFKSLRVIRTVPKDQNSFKNIHSTQGIA